MAPHSKSPKAVIAVGLFALLQVSILFSSQAMAAPQGLAERDITDVTEPDTGLEAQGLLERYAKGSCGLHFRQSREQGLPADFPNGPFRYRLEIDIKDASGNVVGHKVFDTNLSHRTEAIFSELPYTLVVTAGERDMDPLQFAYAGQSWDTGPRSGCSVGRYDGPRGSRQGDCGFDC